MPFSTTGQDVCVSPIFPNQPLPKEGDIGQGQPDGDNRTCLGNMSPGVVSPPTGIVSGNSTPMPKSSQRTLGPAGKDTPNGVQWWYQTGCMDSVIQQLREEFRTKTNCRTHLCHLAERNLKVLWIGQEQMAELVS